MSEIDDFSSNMHAREKGRFAPYPIYALFSLIVLKRSSWIRLIVDCCLLVGSLMYFQTDRNIPYDPLNLYEALIFALEF